MKIEVQIGCEFGYSDIARSVLEKHGCKYATGCAHVKCSDNA